MSEPVDWPALLDEHEAELERDCVPLDGEE